MANAIQIIAPYRYNGTWVFDDPAVELVREPFVAGIPEMIDTLVGGAIGECNRFRLLFADRPFPGSQIELVRQHEEIEGYWYRLAGTENDGWLCPALFKYFDEAPERIYAKVEPIAP